MIDIQKDTPIEYSKQSRDYQVFQFLYNIIFNQDKMYADLIKNIWTDNIDPKLLDLRAYTLNFIPKYQWNNEDLLGATNNFKYLLRTKGTESAIKSCLEILARIKEQSLAHVDVEIVEPGHIRLIVNEEVADVGNIEDLLRYILPAGTIYDIVKFSNQDASALEEIIVDSKFVEERAIDNSDLFIPDSPNNAPGSEGMHMVYPIHTSGASYSTGMLVTYGADGPLKITIRGNRGTFVYDGNPHTVSGYTYTVNRPSEFDENKFHVPSTDPSITGTDVGLYKLKINKSEFSYEGDAEIEVYDGEMRITRGSMAINVTGNNKTVTYTGGLQEVEGYTATGPSSFDIDKLTYLGTTATGDADYIGEINVKPSGAYYMNLNKDKFNYNDPNVDSIVVTITEDGYLIINPKMIMVSLFGNNSEVEYDGQEQTLVGYEVDIPAGETLRESNMSRVSGSMNIRVNIDKNTYSVSGTDVGEYILDLRGQTFNNNSRNYNVTFNKVDGKLVIKPKNGRVIRSDDTSEYVYGEEPDLNWTIPELVKLSDLAAISVNVSGPDSYSNVGTYTVTYSGDEEQGNYRLTYVSDTIEIVPRDAEIIADDISVQIVAPASGDPPAAPPAFTATVNGTIRGDTITYTLDCPTFTGTGTVGDTDTYEIVVTANADQGNYAVTTTNGTLTVEWI